MKKLNFVFRFWLLIFFFASSYTIAGINTGLRGDDVSAGPFPIGFSFRFYENSYTQFFVSTNGMIGFSSGSTAYSNSCSPTISNTLYVFWDDLRTDVTGQPEGKIEYETIGESPNRKLIVQWTNQYFYGINLPMGTFQVILSESSNEIKYQYRNLLNERSRGDSATIAIRGATSNQLIQVSCDQQLVIQEEQALLFSPSEDGTSYILSADAPYEFIDISGLTPLPPSSARNIATSSITWDWLKVSALNTYQISIQTSEGVLVHTENVGNVDSFTFSGLEHGKSYLARVRGSVNSGATWELWSGFSSSVLSDQIPPEVNLNSFEQVDEHKFLVLFDVRDELTGIEYSNLQISLDPTFLNLIFEEIVTGKSTKEYIGGESGQRLYVRLIAQDKAGNQQVSTIRDLLVAPPPIAAFDVSVEFGEAPLDVVFTNQSEGEISSYFWDFGNSKESVLRNPSVQYLVPGVYLVKLKVAGKAGAAESTKSIIVTPDISGPNITEAIFITTVGTSDLDTSQLLTRDGKFSIKATDNSKISHVDFALNGEILARVLITNGQGAYEQAVSWSELADGSYIVDIYIYDMLENVTHKSFNLVVDLVAPEIPTLISPAHGITLNQKTITVTGTALVGTQISIALNGVDVSTDVVDAFGNFSVTLDLQEGENFVSARAQYLGRTKWSNYSAERKITVNTQIPNAPTGVTAVSAKQGQVLLNWNPVTTGNANNQVKGYNVYRATTAFTTQHDAGVQKVNSALISTTNYTNLVIADGDYFYAVTAVNQANNESALSAVVLAKVDSTGPKAVNVTYDSNGNVDALTGRMAPAIVQVTVHFDEPLRNKPYFAIVPNGGLPLAIDLTKSFADDLLYQGQFQITDATPSGTAYVVMSAYDNAGNRGTDVLDGATVFIDTDGPEVVELVLDPNDPLRVDAINGLDINLSIRLNDELPAGQLPRLVPVLDGVIVAGYEQGVSLYQDTSATEGNPLWLGDVHLPTTAGRDAQGQETVQNLSFAYTARDDLDNIATRIHGKNTFQVYQGDLPPLNVPTNLMARAQPGGQVSLTWNAVPNAASYVLYRQGPGDNEPVALEPVTATTYVDETLVDGTYLYAIASVRSVNQQESLSARSDTVSVQTDRVPPGVPRNFVLELNGAGVVSRWEHPLLDAQGNTQITTGITYNLYRLNLPEGQQVSDLTGLTPIQTKIPVLIALDTSPSELEHSYFVTATDAAGNESAPGTTEYLNFGLLPVNQLNIVLPENNFPQLTWQHAGQGISHYRVYRSIAEGEPELLTTQPIAHTGLTTTYIDQAYNNGQTTKGAHIPVTYTVVAVDINEVESLGHSIALPALSVSVSESADTLLKRGVMNRIDFRVDNKGTQTLTGVRLHVAVTVEGVIKHHQSELFTVEAGAFTYVPVVIGGYTNLSGIADLQLRLEQKPQVNESINIHQSHSLLVGNASLLPSLTTEDFTRGGSGVVSFTLENTSDVETEIVMATNNGIADSNEVRLMLEDKQGNVLSIQPVKQYTGSVISIAGGLTIARVAPGQTFTSEPIHVPVPLASPDQVNLRLVIDKFHYHLGKDTHVDITGNGVRRELMLGETPYTAEITSLSPAVIYGKGQSVVVQGRALNRADGQALPNVPVTLAFTVRGFDKPVTAYTDGEGNFTYTYVSDGTSGTYTVSAVHPDITERPNHGEFRVEGGSISPQTLTVNIPRNYTQKIPIKVTAGYDSPLTNVRLVQIGVEEGFVAQLPMGITVTHDALSQVKSRTSGYLNIYFNGDNTANATGLIRFRVEADNLVGEGALGEVTLNYTLSEAKPALAAQPTHIDTGVGLEQQIIENLTLTNKGLDILRNAQASLTRADGSAVPAWIVMASTSQLGDLAIGESRPVQLRISPGAEVSEGNYEFRLRVTSDNMAIFTLPVFVAVTQSGQGNVFFHVSDIYTATLDENNQLIPGLQGARISLQNEQVLTETYNLSTTALGEAFFEGIPAGRYAYRASAFDHASVTGRVWVKPGVTTSEDVFLMNSLVNVEWSVREITIEDRYEIILEATFQTNVPVAVVMLSPLSVQLPVMKKGDLFHGELTLTNHGLIRAINVKQTLPQGSDAMHIEFLREVPETLEAREVVTLPYRIQALRDFNPQADANATGGNSCSVSAQTRVDYQSECANGTVVSGGTSANWNSNWSGCGIPSSGYYYSGSHGFGGYTPSGSPIVGEEPLWCAVVTECEDGNCDNSSGK